MDDESAVHSYRTTQHCHACGGLIPDVSVFCLVCGAAQDGASHATSFDPRALLFWAARELHLPFEVLRTIVQWAPRGLKGVEARWSPCHPQLLPRGKCGRALTLPGSGDPELCYGGYPAMWGRRLPAQWGETTFTVMVSSTPPMTLVSNLYLIGVCRPTSFRNVAKERSERGQLLPMSSYPRECFALRIGGGGVFEIVRDGDGASVLDVELHRGLLPEEASRALVTLTIDSAERTAMFFVNGAAVADTPFPFPERDCKETCYPFVVLNTLGDAVELL